MFKVYISSLSVSIALESNSGDERSSLLFAGNKSGQDIVKTYLSMATGAFGHLFSMESTTPIALHSALISSMPNTKIKIIEGAEMVRNYNQGLPKGVCS